MKTIWHSERLRLAIQISYRAFAVGYSFEWGTHVFLMLGPVMVIYWKKR